MITNAIIDNIFCNELNELQSMITNAIIDNINNIKIATKKFNGIQYKIFKITLLFC
jgi:hypothetical protein